MYLYQKLKPFTPEYPLYYYKICCSLFISKRYLLLIWNLLSNSERMVRSDFGLTIQSKLSKLLIPPFRQRPLPLIVIPRTKGPQALSRLYLTLNIYCRKLRFIWGFDCLFLTRFFCPVYGDELIYRTREMSVTYLLILAFYCPTTLSAPKVSFHQPSYIISILQT